MGKNYGLTNTELEIMEYLWSLDKKVSFRELCEYFQTVEREKLEKADIEYLFQQFKAFWYRWRGIRQAHVMHTIRFVRRSSLFTLGQKISSEKLLIIRC